jgi:hypothetical protein
VTIRPSGGLPYPMVQPLRLTVNAVGFAFRAGHRCGEGELQRLTDGQVQVAVNEPRRVLVTAYRARHANTGAGPVTRYTAYRGGVLSSVDGPQVSVTLESVTRTTLDWPGVVGGVVSGVPVVWNEMNARLEPFSSVDPIRVKSPPVAGNRQRS